MPYSYTTPDDLPLAPPRNTTIPPLWDEIKNPRRVAKSPRTEKSQPATIPAGTLGFLIAHLSHRLTSIPGGLDALRAAVTTLQPILFPDLNPLPT